MNQPHHARPWEELGIQRILPSPIETFSHDPPSRREANQRAHHPIMSGGRIGGALLPNHPAFSHLLGTVEVLVRAVPAFLPFSHVVHEVLGHLAQGASLGAARGGQESHEHQTERKTDPNDRVTVICRSGRRKRSPRT